MSTPSHAVRLGTNIVGTANGGPTAIIPLSRFVVGTPNDGPMSIGVESQALDWYNRVVANGGTASLNTVLAVSKFVQDLTVSGLYSKIIRLNPFCGTNMAAALVPLVKVGGGSLDIAANFVGADYTEATSFVGDGSTKRIDTTYIPSTLTGGIFCHLMTDQPSISAIPIGCRDAGSLDVYRIFSSGPPVLTSAKWGGTVGSQVSVSQLINIGSWHVKREDSVNCKLLKNGVVLNNSTLATTPLGIAPSIYVYAQNNAVGGNAYCTSGTMIGGYAIDNGTMTDGDALKYYNAWRSLMISLGRVV